MHHPTTDICARIPSVTSWPGGARLAVSLAVDFDEGAERSLLDGDTTSEAADPESSSEGAVAEPGWRSLQAESIWEYGPRRGFWRLISIFSRHNVPVTFFCSGQSLERNPVAGRELVARDHEIAGRGYRLLPSYLMTEAEERSDIEQAVEAIAAVVGRKPAGWRSRSPGPRTRRLLAEQQCLVYDSDFQGDDVPKFTHGEGSRLVLVPYSVETTDIRFWPLVNTPGFTSPDHFGDVLRRSFDRLYRESLSQPKMLSIGLRTRISGRPSRAPQVESFIRYAKSFPGIWFARREEIARWWQQNHIHSASSDESSE